jgi:hypothetical protein
VIRAVLRAQFCRMFGACLVLLFYDCRLHRAEAMLPGNNPCAVWTFEPQILPDYLDWINFCGAERCVMPEQPQLVHCSAEKLLPCSIGSRRTFCRASSSCWGR